MNSSTKDENPPIEEDQKFRSQRRQADEEAQNEKQEKELSRSSK